MRRTSTDVCSDTNAHRRSGVTTTPNGLPGTLTVAVGTRPSSGTRLVAVLLADA
jgi:hypothetical protein